jgi:hypothetical protein
MSIKALRLLLVSVGLVSTFLFSLCATIAARAWYHPRAVHAQTVVNFPNASIFLSPYAWRIDGSGDAINPTGGGYIRFTVTGTTQIVANVDTTLNAALSSNDMPTIQVIYNTPTEDGTVANVQFPANNTASTPVTLASGLSSTTTYTVLLSSIGGNQQASNCWSATACQTKINSLQFDDGATLSASTLRPKNFLFYGDSYLLSYFGSPAETGPYYGYINFTLSWPFFVAYGLKWRIRTGGRRDARVGPAGQWKLPCLSGKLERLRFDPRAKFQPGARCGFHQRGHQRSWAIWLRSDRGGDLDAHRHAYGVWFVHAYLRGHPSQ